MIVGTAGHCEDLTVVVFAFVVGAAFRFQVIIEGDKRFGLGGHLDMSLPSDQVGRFRAETVGSPSKCYSWTRSKYIAVDFGGREFDA